MGIAVYFTMYDSYRDFKTDVGTIKKTAWLELFNRGYITNLSDEDIRYIYQKRCYRQCHGDAAMITAILSPAGWFQIVERMRIQEGVKITGLEADVIIKYLEDTYPTVQSKYSYEVRKKTHHAVWRNDMGHNDIYTDVIYATPEYLASIGAERLIDEYDLEHYHVFILSFNVHEGEVAVMNLDKVAFLDFSKGRAPTTPPWNLRFQTADKHHYEGVIRFRKKGKSVINSQTKRMELVLVGIGGVGERLFEWDLPIKYPEGLAATR
ncbi:hypothetical protein MNBD_NITROSPINAE02-1201 [hydrothermal vent metagenome]|uniref:Quinohemoprotein amine dehydrogenase alpha subunit haem binding domain-containing protein n=1 Tax=hydrothermal vent metagenome TaxID=652676 RepID=A0A3B1C5U4_9ZZZZ